MLTLPSQVHTALDRLTAAGWEADVVGRAVGAALQACLDAVMDESLPNDRAALLGYAAENLQRFANS